MHLAILCLVLAALFCVPHSVPASTYFVGAEPCADDANDGLSETCAGNGHGPWRSIAGSLERLAPGDTLLLTPGVYHEHSLRIPRSGTAGKPITLGKLKAGAAVLDGSGAPEGAAGILLEDGVSHIVIDGLTVRNMPGKGIASNDETPGHFEDITIRNCQLQNNGLSGLELAAVKTFLVEDVIAEGNGYYGLSIIGSKDGDLSAVDGLVRRSSFSHHTGPEGHGLAINQGQDIEIRDCNATHNRIHGFDVSDWPKGGALSCRIRFHNNRAWENGKAGFAVNSDSSDVVYIRNLAWNNGAHWAWDESAPGFWCYEGCRNISWINNTAVNNSLAGFRVDDAAGMYDGKPPDANLTFINNIAWDNGVPEWNEMFALYVSKAAWTLDIRGNAFGADVGADALVVGLDMKNDKGALYAMRDISDGLLQGVSGTTPRFRNEASWDFSLVPGSRLIDAGAPTPAEHCGSAPDIGAMEFCH